MINWKDKLFIGEGSWGIMIYGRDEVVQLCNLLYVIWKLEVLKKNTKDCQKKKLNVKDNKTLCTNTRSLNNKIRVVTISKDLSGCDSTIWMLTLHNVMLK